MSAFEIYLIMQLDAVGTTLAWVTAEAKEILDLAKQAFKDRVEQVEEKQK